MNPVQRGTVCQARHLSRRAAQAVILSATVCVTAAMAQAVPPAPGGAGKSEPDSVVVCGTCATVLSVKSETRVARKGVGTTAGATLDSGVLGDQPEGRGINDTTNAPPGTTSAGLVIPKGERRLTGSTGWSVVLQRRDGSTASVQLADDPVLRPGDTVTFDDGKITSVKR